MKYPIKLFAPLLGLGILLGLNAEESSAQSQGCKELGPLPTTINTSGIYCLKSNRSVGAGPIETSAIEINASNVVLDLGGFRLRGTAEIRLGQRGITCDNCSQVVVRNGVVQGFEFGISLCTSNTCKGNVVENIQAFRNSVFGISVGGHGGIARHNTIIDTIGTIGPSGVAIGIQLIGTGMRQSITISSKQISQTRVISEFSSLREAITWRSTIALRVRMRELRISKAMENFATTSRVA